ncbi:MAG: hypothetical protein SGBAC_008307 [Bacillariaceae sp.]
MGKSRRRQSTPVVSSKFNASLSEEITDDDIYAAFGLKDDSEQGLKLDPVGQRKRSKKKLNKRKSAPVKRMSIYDILYEDEEEYEIPNSVFDVESPQSNEKKLKRPKSTGKPVAEKIPTFDEEPSLFDLLISPRESKDKYGKKKKKLRNKELVADLGKPTLDDHEENSEPPSESLPVLNDVSLDVRPIGMTTKRGKKSKKARSKSLLVVDLDSPPMAVCDSTKLFSASDGQLDLSDPYLEIKPTKALKRGKRQKKVKSKSLVADLGDSTTEEESESSSYDYPPVLDDEPLEVRSRSMMKRDKKAKKVRSKSLVIDLGNPPMVVSERVNLLSASDSQLLPNHESLEISPSNTTKHNKKSKKVKSRSYLMHLDDPTGEEESPELMYSADCVIPLNDESLDITPSSMTKREKKTKKVRSKSLMMDLGESDIKIMKNFKRKESSKDALDRDGLDQEVLPRRRCRSHSPHPRRSLIQWGEHELHTIAESSESEESDDDSEDRWSSNSVDSPPHVPRKRRKRRKSCSPPLARSPNRLWLESFEVSLDANGKSENKNKKKKKKRKSKEKSIEKPIYDTEKPNQKPTFDTDTMTSTDETHEPNSKHSFNSNASSKESKKESSKQNKRNSNKQESNTTSATSLDSSIDDSMEMSNSSNSLDCDASPNRNKTKSPKKKRLSKRKSKLDSSLNDSTEFAAALEAAEEEASRVTNEAIVKLRAEEDARRRAEQESKAAKLRLQVVKVQRKVEEEERLRAKNEANRQVEEEAMRREQVAALRNTEREDERQQLLAEQERLQQERAELEVLRKAEQDRLAKERVELQRQKEEEAERLAKQRADLERRKVEEKERLQREKEEHERQYRDEKARIKAEQEAEKLRLKAKAQERERWAKEEKIRLKAEKQERDRLAREEKARIKAEKDAECARIKAAKVVEKARIKAEKEAEKTRMKREKVERERMTKEDQARTKSEQEAEMRRQNELATKEAELRRQKELVQERNEQEKPAKLAKPSRVARDYSIDSLFQGSIDNSLHAEAEERRMRKDREQLEREVANLERQKKAAAERLQRRADAMRASLKKEKPRVSKLDAGMHDAAERAEEEEGEDTRRRMDLTASEHRERAPSPETREEAKERARKEAWTRKQEKRKIMEEKAAEDYRLGKLDGRRSISKNDRTFNSGWNKVVVPTKKNFTH